MGQCTWLRWIVLSASISCVGQEAPPTFDDPNGISAWQVDDHGIPTIALPAGGGTFDGRESFARLQAALNVNGATTGGITLSEGNVGVTAAFNLVLSSAPSANVTVTPSSSDTTEATVSGAVTFTPSNWSTPQAVTITAVDDALADGSQPFIISVTTVSSDSNWNGLSASLVSGTTLDDEHSTIRVTASGLTTDKTGASSTMSVVLTSQPTANVTIGLSSSAPYTGSVSPSSFTFTSGNWSTPQTVTLTGQRNFFDNPTAGGTSYLLSIGPITSGDSTYGSMPTQQVLSTNTDTDHLSNRLVLLAGNVGSSGNVDGTGPSARFNNPDGVAVDSSGNVFVTDSNNNTIRKITPTGVTTTFAGSVGVSGTADGTGGAARFNGPQGVATDGAGNVYVADTANHTLRKITPTGVVSTLAGSAGVAGNSDGTGTGAQFSYFIGITADASGTVYVTDNGNHTFRKITAAGVVTTIAGSAGAAGTADGTGAAARFNFPRGLALDASGNAFVADYLNDTIRKITPLGVVTTIAGSPGVIGNTDGTGSVAQFDNPNSLTVDASGNIYVADSSNDTIRLVTPAGVVSTIAGAPHAVGGSDGTASTARFNNPNSITIDASGMMYIADVNNHAIRKITAAGVVTTLAGTPIQYAGVADATGSAARFYAPQGVAVDSSGNVYVADVSDSGIRKITPAGAVTKLAGSNTSSLGTADGTGSAATFFWPQGVAVDASNNVYVADSYASTIRKITPTAVVTTIAGNVSFTGSTDGTGTAARFSMPTGIAMDGSGNAYVTDYTTSIIRKISPAFVVTTFAGSGGVTGTADGTGAAAQFLHPTGVAVDTSGNAYIADYGNHLIRKISAAGVVSTFAGGAGATGSADGTGTAARFYNPKGVALDANGNVYVADYNNSLVRKITAAGVVTTVLGTVGLVGSVENPIPSTLYLPNGIATYNGLLVVTTANGVMVANKSSAW